MPQIPSTHQDLSRACWLSIRRTFNDHIPLYLCAFVFVGAAGVIAAHYGIALSIEASVTFLEMAPQFLLLAAAVIGFRELVRLGGAGLPPHPSRAVGLKLLATLTQGDRPGNMFHSLVTLTPLMIAFAALKDAIPAIHPFDWDTTLAHWDRVIGGGMMPWQILQPIFGHWPITATINIVYELWFFVMFGSLFAMAFSARSSTLRMQFLLAFAFLWFFAGNILATVFSSVGPCFYGRLLSGPNPYAAQMAYLHAASQHFPIWSLQVQDLLWQSYVTGHGTISGISAMPSMHVSIAVLVACLCCRMGKRWAIASVLFASTIFIGSIHLGWHYAVDGIAGGGLTLSFWALAGWAVRALPSAKVKMLALPPRESIA